MIGEMLLQHEHQHNETMLQTLQLAEPGVYAPERERPAGPAATGSVVVEARPVEIGFEGEGFAYDNERPRHRVELSGLPDRPRAGDQRAVPRVRRGRRLPAPRAVVARGLVLPRARGLGASAVLDRRRRGAPLRPRRAARARAARDARLGLRGRRLRALARRAAADRGRVGARGRAVRARARRARPARLRARSRRPVRRRLLGVDGERVRGLPGLRGLPVPRVLGGLLRRGLPRAARRRVGDPHPGRAPELPQLGPPAAAADLRRLPMRWRTSGR